MVLYDALWCCMMLYGAVWCCMMLYMLYACVAAYSLCLCMHVHMLQVTLILPLDGKYGDSCMGCTQPTPHTGGPCPIAYLHSAPTVQLTYAPTACMYELIA